MEKKLFKTNFLLVLNTFSHFVSLKPDPNLANIWLFNFSGVILSHHRFVKFFLVENNMNSKRDISSWDSC